MKNIITLNNTASNSSPLQEIHDLLDSFSHFGVDLGLDRILKLLGTLENPHQQIPIIHVAGTNGKGSVCAYLSSILTQAGYRVGRYTSPHLIDWNERICIDGQPIASLDLLKILVHIKQVIGSDTPSPTQFEVITAAAWCYFAQQSVDIAVIEVGLGGRLDATNVCDRPLVSVITSISREHWQRLGPTLADIANEKAGILKPQCPAVIGQLPNSADAVVKARSTELDCPIFWIHPAQEVSPGYATFTPPHQLSDDVTIDVSNVPSLNAHPIEGNHDKYLPPIQYPLALPGRHQLMNSALAIATILILRQQSWHISDKAIHQGMQNTTWHGRIQWGHWQGHDLLIDGAHNPAAAAVLRDYVDQSNRVSKPVHWVMGILSTKDHADIFKALLREGDRLSLVPVPDHSSADPTDLAAIAQQTCPNLEKCETYPELFEALKIACQTPQHNSNQLNARQKTVVLCGSLYLIGYLFRQLR